MIIDSSHITMKMWKSWIADYPELALEKVDNFCKRAEANHMFKKMHETEHYVYIVASVSEEDLDLYYA